MRPSCGPILPAPVPLHPLPIIPYLSCRQLRLGDTLKALDGGSYQIDLSQPSLHKTSAVFGPTRATVTPSVAVRVQALVDFESLETGDYLFHLHADKRSPLKPSAWTEFVQATFQTYSGQRLSPKDCRSSFISWLRSGQHGDETLKAAADAMHHSSKVSS